MENTNVSLSTLDECILDFCIVACGHPSAGEVCHADRCAGRCAAMREKVWERAIDKLPPQAEQQATARR
jgi:hypothetical protein